MSSHHSSGFFQLHYKQVADARERRRQRAADREASFLQVRTAKRAEWRADSLCILGFSFLWFAYMALSSVAYLGYIVRA